MKKTPPQSANEVLISTAPKVDPVVKIGSFSKGFAAGFLAQTLSTPIQNLVHIDKTNKSFTQAIQIKFQQEGLRSFWKNNLTYSLILAPKSGLQFSIYHAIIKLTKKREKSVMNRILAGSLSSFLTNTILYPFSVIRNYQCQMIPEESASNISVIQKVQEMYSMGGIFSFTKGYVNSLPLSFTQEIIMSSIYACASKKYRKKRLMIEKVYHASITTLISEFLTYPLSVIQRNLDENEYDHILKQMKCAAKSIYQNHNILGFYDGFGSTLIQRGTVMTLNFMFLQEFQQLLENRKKLQMMQKPIEQPVIKHEPQSSVVQLRTWKWF